MILELVILFFLLAIIAGFLGFRSLSDSAMWFAKVLLIVFIILLIVSIII